MTFKFKTLEGIARVMGAKAFKHFAHDYGNSHVSIAKSVTDAIASLHDYGDDYDLINYFNSLHDYPELIYTYKDLN